MEQLQTDNNGNTPATSNGNKPSKKRTRSLPTLPSVASASDMTDVTYSCKADSTPTSWDVLPLYGVFSLSPDGSFPMVKISKSKACDLRTAKSIPVGSGRCYRVIL
ncbi:MAG: hypothetical protein WBA07_01580 [Rivularia sp. (in: cyanobacteria)]